MSKKDVRKKLIQASIKLYAKNGVAEVRLNQVAELAGVKPSLLKYHFPTLKSLHLEVIHFLLEELRGVSVDAIQKGKNDPEKSLRHYALAPLGWAHKNRGHAAIFIYFYHMAAVDKEYESLSTQIRNVGRDRIRLLIYKIQENSGRLKSKLTMDEMVTSIQSQMTGLAVLFSSENGLKYSVCRKIMNEYLDSILA